MLLLQVRGAPYGTLSYVLRLELHKRSATNRAIVLATAVCVLGGTTSCLLLAGARLSAQGRPVSELGIFSLELLLQGLACFILYHEVGT